MYYVPEEVVKLRQERKVKIISIRRSKVRFIDTELFQCISFITIILSIVFIMYILAAIL